ncbi:hypothetical protein Srubr_19810 [Streptomyces rubradiris]|uniref:Transposase n=1 Tax=Streptomyces rubradiris TaxID=285531 RepID=A0ABQ3R8F6_STRRR|nr:hypothetical protein GCM10018792_59550 [Streptomyces rubradiris]GHI52135.1 hypothetical protein Srubr_19810 [Streptomyces rubradiris]
MLAGHRLILPSVVELEDGNRPIGWQPTRRRQIEDALPVPTARYEERQGHAPGERASYALACQADQCRPPKRTELLSLTELRERWRASAIRAFGACTVYRLAERTRWCGRGCVRWPRSSWRPWTPSPWTVQAAVDDHTRPVGRGRSMTADLCALYRAAPRTRPCRAR